MEITIHIYYTGTNGSAKQFAQQMLASGLVQAIRAEEGNLQYDYFLPLDKPETVLLIDRWSSPQALDAHHASPMMAQIAALRETYDLHMRVERFVADESEQAPADSAFVRK